MTDKEWLLKQIAYLEEEHRYYSNAAQQKRAGRQKDENYRIKN